VSAARTGGGGRSRALPFLLLLFVLAGAGGGIVVTKAGIRLRRRVHRDPRRVAAACRQELEAFLVDQRIDVAQSATLRELGELVRDTLGAQPAAFVSAATAARFGPDAGAAAGAAMARRELHALLGEARRSLTRGERLRGLFSLRSLVRPPVAVDASASLESGIA
jgi:hypothetical protein